MALKTHVKVTDVPPKWKQHMHGLRVELEDNAEENIHEAAHDVEDAWNDIKDSDVVHNLGEAAMEWGTSDEVEDQADEIKENYEELEETHWHEDFDHAFEEAFT